MGSRERSPELVNKLPRRGIVLKGEVSRITEFGAFVKIPGYTDGLIHVTRIDESGKRMFTATDVRKRIPEGQEVFAKVLRVEPGKVTLDYRFVDQRTGQDNDPEDEMRLQLDGDKNGGTDKFGDANKDLPELNSVHSATVHSTVPFGAFLVLGDGTRFKHGLLPTSKMNCAQSALKIGDPLYVKVVGVQQDKFNVDMRFVDQRTGRDLDPDNVHSDEVIKVTSNSVEKDRRVRSPRRRSRSPVERYKKHSDRPEDKQGRQSYKRSGRSRSVSSSSRRSSSSSVIRRRPQSSSRRPARSRSSSRSSSYVPRRGKRDSEVIRRR